MQFQPDYNKPQANIIKVIGVGGGGSNAVNHMFKKGIEGVDFYICNTDIQALRNSAVPNRITIGGNLTSGLGAGSLPDIGEKSAEESIQIIKDILGENTKMIFITAGMGGGTGTGAAPVIAKTAKELGVLTVGIVTMPFEDEGQKRNSQAKEGVDKLKPHVDALLTICNDRIVDMFGDLTISEAFAEADEILCTAAKGIAEIISKPGKINVDFMDVKTAMENSGHAIMGTGIASGEGRSEIAVKMALQSPLLENTSILGASHLLVNVAYGSSEPTMSETKRIKTYLQDEAGNQAHLKMGITSDPDLGDSISVTVIATGFEAKQHSLNHSLIVEAIEPLANPGLPIETISYEDNFVQQAPPQRGFIKNEIDILPPTVDQIFQSLEGYQEPPISENPIHRAVQTNMPFEQPAPATFHKQMESQEQNRIAIMENNYDIPSWMRKNIELHVAPNSSTQIVSKFTIGEEDSSNERDYTVRPNRHLHGNVD